jgi:glycosyltransferase involved in cell wall biosynthesis
MTCLPTVTIVIPFYNREKWLPRSVGSVLKQTFTHWELVLVDDRSTDGSRAVAEEYVRSDARIRYAPNTHKKGPAGGRNQGVELARGRYIAFLDSDDEWLPHHLETMISYLERYPDRIDLMTANPINKNYFTSVEKEDQIDLSSWKYERIEDAYVLDVDMLFPMALKSRIIIPQTFVSRRSLFDKVRFDEEIYGLEDCFMWLEIAHRKFRVGHIQRPHAIVWKHDDNTTDCNGMHSPSRRLPVFLGVEALYRKTLSTFALDREQETRVKTLLAEHCVWGLAYNCYLPLGNFTDARRYIRKALQLQPLKPAFWKSYFGTFLKQLLRRRPSSVSPSGAS